MCSQSASRPASHQVLDCRRSAQDLKAAINRIPQESFSPYRGQQISARLLEAKHFLLGVNHMGELVDNFPYTPNLSLTGNIDLIFERAFGILDDYLNTADADAEDLKGLAVFLSLQNHRVNNVWQG
uniref:DNA helicase n=1 Tax=Globodera pallida TaxID=36090 RepID=A0A183CJ47_GLOPA